MVTQFGVVLERKLEGRLEVTKSGRWGTVCSDDFSPLDAQVACSSMGLSGGFIKKSSDVADGGGFILMDSVQCGEGDTDFTSCPFGGWAQTDCNHTRDVGVACSYPQESQFGSVSARLVNPNFTYN